MPQSLSEFKKAFKEMQQREGKTEKELAVEKGLEDMVAYLRKRHEKVRTRLDELKKKFKDGIETAVQKRVEEAEVEPDEDQVKGIRKEIVKAVKTDLDSANKMLIEANETGDYDAAEEQLEELDAMLDDFFSGGTTNKLRTLFEQRLENNRVVDETLEKSPPESTGVRMDGKQHAEGVEDGPAQRSVSELFEDRTKAQAWQQEEIEAVEKAHKALVDLDKEFGYSALVEKWLEDLKDENTKRRTALEKAAEDLNTARSAVKRADKAIKEATKYIAKSRKLIEESPQDDRVARWQLGIKESEEELREADEARNSGLDDIDRLKDRIPILAKAVNDGVDEANTELDEAIDTLRDRVHEKDDTVAVARPDVDTDKFRVEVPDLSGEDDVSIPDGPEDDEIRIDPTRMFPDLERVANKHGSGRHGAQTGIEQQARRLATDGRTPDQDGHEWGTSRPVQDEEGNALASVTWRTVKITWTEDGKKRVVENEDAVVKAIVTETRRQGASASSMFLNPEVEQEAATRALDIVKAQVPWTEVQDDGGWKPLNRVVVTVSRPRTVKAIGYGHGLVTREEDKAKLTLQEANKVLKDFRDGRIDQNQMLDGLNTTLVMRDEKGGAKIMPCAKVVVDRVGKGWSNTSQFPCDDEVGWDLTGKQVRSPDTDEGGVAAPPCDNP